MVSSQNYDFVKIIQAINRWFRGSGFRKFCRRRPRCRTSQSWNVETKSINRTVISKGRNVKGWDPFSMKRCNNEKCLRLRTGSSLAQGTLTEREGSTVDPLTNFDWRFWYCQQLFSFLHNKLSQLGVYGTEPSPSVSVPFLVLAWWHSELNSKVKIIMQIFDLITKHLAPSETIKPHTKMFHF